MEVEMARFDLTDFEDADAATKLKERTLTNLYNQRPQWLANPHEALDRAVAAAYGQPEDVSAEEALEKLRALDLARASAAASRPQRSHGSRQAKMKPDGAGLPRRRQCGRAERADDNH
jgi:predicted dehydrogenase